MRLKTHFPVLDKLLGGGFPQQSLVAMNDTSTASGWTLVSSIISHELEKGNYGVIMSFGHSPDLLREQLKISGIIATKFEEEQKLFFVNCFKFAEKTAPLTITNPSSGREVMKAFREINEITEGKMKDRTVCVVDSMLTLSTLFTLRHAVGFGLLMREITKKYGCIVFLLVPESVDEKCAGMIEYSADVAMEFRIREYEGKERPMLRIKRRLSVPPSNWIPYVTKGGSVREIG